MEVCTTLSAFSRSPAPTQRDITESAPTLSPMNKLTMRLTRELVEPTAAIAVWSANCPTVMMSAALYKSCRMPDAAKGRKKSRILPKSGRVHMSISRFFFLGRTSAVSITKPLFSV